MMEEFKVVRLDTGSLMTRRGYYGLHPETEHGTFSTLKAAQEYVNDLQINTSFGWLEEYGYEVQKRTVTEWCAE